MKQISGRILHSRNMLIVALFSISLFLPSCRSVSDFYEGDEYEETDYRGEEPDREDMEDYYWEYMGY